MKCEYSTVMPACMHTHIHISYMQVLTFSAFATFILLVAKCSFFTIIHVTIPALIQD